MALTKIDDRGLKTPIDLLDNEKIRFGTGNDLELYHAGSTNIINSHNTWLNVNSDGGIAFRHPINADGSDGDDLLKLHPDAQVELYYDGSKKFETTSSGAIVTGQLSADNLILGDNEKLYCGDGDDLQIYHDGSHSYIKNSTGNLYNLASDWRVNNAANTENMIIAQQNGSVQLYYDNSKKLETTSTGIKIFPGGDTSTVNASTETSGDTFVLRVNKDGTDATSFKLKTQASGGSIVDRFEISSTGTTEATGALKVQNSGNVSFNIRDTSANAVSNWLEVKTAGTAEYNCYKEGVGTAYPHVFKGYTTEYARIDTNGIKFNGDTAAANALDDYEEGDHTAVMTLGSGTITTTHTANLSYTKVGRLVTVFGRLYIELSASDVTSFQFTLPFTCANLGTKVESMNILHVFRATAQSNECNEGIRSFRIDSNTNFAKMVDRDNGTYGEFGVTNPHIGVNFQYYAA